jgi:hypothetical protein
MKQFEIGGRSLQLAGEGTARHDMYTMRQIAACGLNTMDQRNGETDEQFQYRLYLTAMRTGDIFLLLGSLLVPAGTPPLGWTPEMSADTANFLANLTEPAAKNKLRIILVSSLMPFFLGGRRSSRTSPKFSMHPGSGPRPIVSVVSANTATGD